jgi:hypothetical protein
VQQGADLIGEEEGLQLYDSMLHHRIGPSTSAAAFWPCFLAPAVFWPAVMELLVPVSKQWSLLQWSTCSKMQKPL